MRRLLPISTVLIALVAALSVAGTGAAQGQTPVTVTLTEFKVSMATTSIPAGVPITFAAVNNGQMTHEVVLERAGAVDQPFEMNGEETEIEDIAPGQTKSATWTLTQPGEYQLACHLPGHYEAGMVERFTVTAASGATQVRTPMQLAAPGAEDQAEHEGLPAASATMVMPQATPATLPVTGGSGDMSALWWAAVAVVGLIAAVIGAFRFIVSQIGGEK